MQPLRRASRARGSCRAARGGRARPAGDRAGDAAAGRHRAHAARASSPERSALALAVYGASLLGLARSSRRGSRRGRRARRSGPRLGLPRGRRRRALGARPAGRPALPEAPPEARARRPGTAFTEDARLLLAPGARARSRALHGEGKVPCCPPSATTTPTSRTSPPATTGRSARSTPHCAPAGSAATSTASGRRTTRSRGSRSTARSRRRSRPRGPGRGDRRRRPATTSGRNDVWGEVEDRMLETLAPLGAAQRRRPGAADRRRRSTDAGRPAAPAAAAVPVDERDHEPGRLPADATTRSRSGSPGSPRCSPPACRCAASRSAPRATTTPTPTRPDASTEGLEAHRDALLAFQRDLEARGLADRVLVHVWSEFGRRAEENGSGHRPRRRRRRLPDRHPRARARWSASSPACERPRRGRQPARDLGLPRRLLRAARAVVRRRRRRRDPGRQRLRPARARPLASACTRTYVRLLVRHAAAPGRRRPAGRARRGAARAGAGRGGGARLFALAARARSGSRGRCSTRSSTRTRGSPGAATLRRARRAAPSGPAARAGDVRRRRPRDDRALAGAGADLRDRRRPRARRSSSAATFETLVEPGHAARARRRAR